MDQNGDDTMTANESKRGGSEGTRPDSPLRVPETLLQQIERCRKQLEELERLGIDVRSGYDIVPPFDRRFIDETVQPSGGLDSEIIVTQRTS